MDGLHGNPGKYRTSPVSVLLLLPAAIFLARTVALMMGPMLVQLATEFQTSVAMAGQLAAATPVTWGITAPLMGPLSDTYGRRLVALTGLMLMAIGTLGSALAWDYSSLLTFRLLSGVGGAMVPPTVIAAIADHFLPENRGKAIGWLVSTSWLGAVLVVPIVALGTDIGGWRLPFYVLGTLLLVVWGLLWVWFPRGQRQPGRTLAFFSHFNEVGRSGGIWYVLIANALAQTAFFGFFTYLAAYLIQTYGMKEGETALPLALIGAGAVVGSVTGGIIAGRVHRLALLSIALLGGGLLTGLAFTVDLSPWATVALSFGILTLLSIALPVLATLTTELGGHSVATAIGMFAISNQLGGVGGASAGGLVLSLGGFPLVGIFCLGAAAVAAVVVRLKVRDSAEFRQRMGLHKVG